MQQSELWVLGKPTSYDGSLCGECSWCCYVYDVMVPDGFPPERPDSTDLFQVLKPGGKLCQWHSQTGVKGMWPPGGGCFWHDDGLGRYPPTCRAYACPFVRLEFPAIPQLAGVLTSDGRPYPYQVHRPDVFAAVLREPWVEAQGIMPLVPVLIPARLAVILVRITKLIPAAIVRDGLYVAIIRELALLDASAKQQGKAAWTHAEEIHCR